MAILVFVEIAEGKIKKTSIEAVAYANAMGDDVIALAMGEIDQSELVDLGNYGATKVLHVGDSRLNNGVIIAYANVISVVMKETGATTLVLANSSLGGSVSARVAIKTNASLVSNVVALPDTSSGFKVKRSIYTGKAFATVTLNKTNKILSIKKNAVEVKETGGTASVENYEINLSAHDFSAKILGVEKATGDVLLPEAEIVVSGGRGLKGPENWGIIEDLAQALGAATGCSKPVSDMDWRPHHEHVGQTGVKVSPNLYIAVGISGAIQHLAGVNSSKYIVV
ncbi:MAG: electron transfer flavoprotein subunit alpha/FixB family protein, partial [Cyclobacteriaceae bacterium]|nr:electron transfer flavoprotein subunit alpha/FixB family protein [Cyclobacteriaceae bacterium]